MLTYDLEPQFYQSVRFPDEKEGKTQKRSSVVALTLGYPVNDGGVIQVRLRNQTVRNQTRLSRDTSVHESFNSTCSAPVTVAVSSMYPDPSVETPQK